MEGNMFGEMGDLLDDQDYMYIDEDALQEHLDNYLYDENLDLSSLTQEELQEKLYPYLQEMGAEDLAALGGGGQSGLGGINPWDLINNCVWPTASQIVQTMSPLLLLAFVPRLLCNYAIDGE
jgi:hypothetical protein